MKNTLNEIADLLMYSGPSIEQLMMDAESNGNKIEVYEQESLTILVIESELPYKVTAVDSYTYNKNGELIKHIIKVNNKEKMIFDKFQEINYLLNVEKQHSLIC